MEILLGFVKSREVFAILLTLRISNQSLHILKDFLVHKGLYKLQWKVLLFSCKIGYRGNNAKMLSNRRFARQIRQALQEKQC